MFDVFILDVKSSRDGFNILDNFNISSIKTAIVNMIVMRHNRRPSMQISHKLVVLRYVVDGFGSFWLVLFVVVGSFGGFWLVPCFSNHGRRS